MSSGPNRSSSPDGASLVPPAPPSLLPPEVDALEVLVLVDNVTDLVSSLPSDVDGEIANLRQAGMERLAGEHLCCACFGLALVLTVRRGDETHTLLFDGGPEGDVLARNGDRLGLRFGGIDGVVLSHGHWDHAGGLGRALELIRADAPHREVPFYLHPDSFRPRGMTLADGSVLPYKPILTPAELAARGARPVVSSEPQLAGGLFCISGEIARRTSYERGLPGHVAALPEGGWEDDRWLLDERFVAVRVRGKGLVVFTACSHAGVINVLHHARDSFPSIPLYSIFGGFHLAGAEIEPNIPTTVRDMKPFGLRRIVPGHCTGWRAVAALHQAFGDDVVVPSAVGRRFRY